jgi:hypothetical protein
MKGSSELSMGTTQQTTNMIAGAPPSTRAPLVFHKVNDAGI